MTGMNSMRTQGHSAVGLTQLRRTRWFGGVLFAAVLCTVGLYALEFAHHHETTAAELHCPICQVMAHGALDVFAPQFKPLPPVTRVHFLAFAPHQVPAPARVFTVKYQSRAPPLV
ncbi:MAG: hypothetical protein KGJ17_07590 [Gammaproteobacteria bacterium]|nr:hypothetical protein [Gammaproteobacteria bacterium]MDE2140349.1 hypothetical protein [Gammaproteobacteria bacterium]